MQQEVERELEFISREKPKLKCFDCEKEFSHLERCKDGKNRCKHCKKKMITNIFYNPNWKNRNFVGINNMSEQEISIQITNLMRQGLTREQARNRVFNDLRIIRRRKKKIEYQESIPSPNLNIKKKNELNNNLAEGLGLKIRCPN
jgi:DNA-directed RNA polymerase subunit RPC12/RpoP